MGVSSRMPASITLKLKEDRLTIEWMTYACNWNQCIFCGYDQEHSLPNEVILTKEDVISQLELALASYQAAAGSSPEMVEIFPSGSFYDQDENALSGREVIDFFSQRGVRRFKSSTRIQYIPWEDLEKDPPPIPTIVYIGLESALDERLRQMKKGITLAQFEQAVARSQEIPNFYIGAHLIAKPTPIEKISEELSLLYPHPMTEDEIAAVEFKYSIEKALEIFGYNNHREAVLASPFPARVTLRQTIPAKGSVLNEIWKAGGYHSIPPKNYWEVISQIKETYGSQPFHHIGGAQPWFARK